MVDAGFEDEELLARLRDREDYQAPLLAVETILTALLVDVARSRGERIITIAQDYRRYCYRLTDRASYWRTFDGGMSKDAANLGGYCNQGGVPNDIASQYRTPLQRATGSLGNIDTREPLPKGLVHVRGRDLCRLCDRLQIPYRKALVAIERSYRYYKPRFDGVVVPRAEEVRLREAIASRGRRKVRA